MLTIIFASLACLLSLIMTPLIRKVAVRLNVMAARNHRTVHLSATPKLGGLGVFVAFAAAALAYTAFAGSSHYIWGLVIGGAAAVALGLYDDIYGIDCYTKLLGQSVAAAIAVGLGYTIHAITLPSGTIIELGALSVPVTILWIVGIMNAVNLLDGLDGLASGFSVIVTAVIAVGALLFGHPLALALTLFLMGACAGFLKFNFFPARIFLGDSGSLFLGFALACLSISAFSGPHGSTPVLTVILVFIVPISDTILAIIRRTFQGRHPFSADRDHIHHRLLRLGLGQVSAVLIVYSVTLFCCLTGLLLLLNNSTFALAWVILFLGLFAWGLRQAGCFDFLIRKLLPGKVWSHQSKREDYRPGRE